ncbi:MAG: DUF3857 and transglutaminase domain-containing protein [Polaribacter sp.]|nr:DUF3857 and transglutaminase domain-containing protein [Polaribacter sp.]
MNIKVNFTLILLLFISNISAQDLKFGKVSKEEVEEKFYPEDSSAVAAYLYKYRRTHYEYNSNTGFVIVNDYHIRIKVYDKKGVDYGNFDINFYDPEDGKGDKITTLNGYVFNLDEKGNLDKQKLGKDNIFKERINKFRATNKIAMPNVKEGSVIDLEYSISSPFIYYIDDLEFQSAIPYKKYYAKIEIPDWFVFNKYAKGYFSIPPKTASNSKTINVTQRGSSYTIVGSGNSVQSYSETLNFKTDEYEADNIPALKDDEPYVSNIDNYYGGISYELSMTRFPNQPFETFTNTWEKVCKTIYDSKGFGDQVEPANFYKDDVAAATASATNQFEKIAAIFSLVKSKVKWNEYYGKYSTEGIRNAYKEGTGNAADINLLLTSMLNSVGVNANPVLVSTRNNGIPFFPTLEGFNYVISMVEFNDGSYMLLDATEPYSLPNILPVRALNWNGRRVTKDGFSNWVKLTPNKPSESDYNLIVKVTNDGLVEGLLRKRSENLNAMQERNMYNHVKEDALIKMFEERYNIEIVGR